MFFQLEEKYFVAKLTSLFLLDFCCSYVKIIIFIVIWDAFHMNLYQMPEEKNQHALKEDIFMKYTCNSIFAVNLHDVHAGKAQTEMKEILDLFGR